MPKPTVQELYNRDKEQVENLSLDRKPELPEFAFPGGYPIYYTDGQNSVLCASCATTALLEEEWEEWQPQHWDIYHEGSPMYCEDCNAIIESAYGDFAE